MYDNEKEARDVEKYDFIHINSVKKWGNFRYSLIFTKFANDLNSLKLNCYNLILLLPQKRAPNVTKIYCLKPANSLKLRYSKKV